MTQRERNAWIERAKERVLDNAKETDAYVRDLMELYDETANQLELEIRAMYQEYAKDNAMTEAEASRMLTGEEYSRWRKSIDRYVAEAERDSRTLRELNTLSAKSRISRKEQMLSEIYQSMITLSGETETKLADLLGGLFQTNYYRSCYDIQSVLKVGFSVSKVDEGMLKRVLTHPWSGKNFSQNLWGNTDRLAALARREITLGFMSGAGIQKMAKAVNDVMGRGRMAAERLVRTESSYFSNQGELASYQEMGIEEYIFLGGGCEICQELNGQAFRMSEAEPGVNMPPMHPNCRCTVIAKTGSDVFRNRKGADPLKDNPKFEDWKRKYVQADGLSATVGGKNGVAEHEEKKLLERVDFQDRRLVQSKTEEYTEQIAGDDQKENAVCITREGNIYHCQGISDAVYPGYDLGDELTGAYVTHNHPISETHFSFSYDDISIFMDYKLPELTGVDEEYKYVIRRTEETIYAERSILEHAYKGENYAEFMNKVMNGEADAETDEYDFYVRRLSEEYGFEYERKKR